MSHKHTKKIAKLCIFLHPWGNSNFITTSHYLISWLSINHECIICSRLGFNLILYCSLYHTDTSKTKVFAFFRSLRIFWFHCNIPLLTILRNVNRVCIIFSRFGFNLILYYTLYHTIAGNRASFCLLIPQFTGKVKAISSDRFVFQSIKHLCTNLLHSTMAMHICLSQPPFKFLQSLWLFEEFWHQILFNYKKNVILFLQKSRQSFNPSIINNIINLVLLAYKININLILQW